MIDEDDARSGLNDSGLAALYDWFKYLTSLSLLTLGGVLSLVQGSDGVPIKKSLLIVVLAFVVTSGLASFASAAQVVKSRTEGVPLPASMKMTQTVIGFSLSGAVGAFIYIFVSTLK
jgi:hypothetical protein